MLKNYIHLSYLNLSKNDIHDVSCIADLTHLLSFQASGCAIKSLDFMAANPQSLQYLQVSVLGTRIHSVTVVARFVNQQDHRTAQPETAPAHQDQPG